MSDFTAILSNTIVSLSTNSVRVSDGFTSITGSELLTKLRHLPLGVKDGSHFLRTNLNIDEMGRCLTRSDSNANSMASLLIIDGDKRLNSNGEELDGAPDPHKISQILRSHYIGHVLYGSYSHYVGNIGNRYRIIVSTKTPYTKEQLPPTVEAIISLINSKLNGELLANAKENHTWSQPWYYPRKPLNSPITELYFEYLEGEAIEVIEPLTLPPISKTISKPTSPLRDEKISVIDAFNEQNHLPDLLSYYGYKKVYFVKDHEKWVRPDSTSRNPGITVRSNKFYSHHNDPFNDGYWHDAFDLMRETERLSPDEAIIKAAQNTLAPNGQTVDEYNKSQHKKRPKSNIQSNPIPHTEILDQLLGKVLPVSFRKIANITDEKEKLKPHHFYVIVIETILQLAKQQKWGLCRNHDFIYVYNGEYWSLVDEDNLKSFLGNSAEKMAVDKFSARYFNFRDQLYKQFLALAHLPKPAQPKDVIFINLKNGTFEITPTSTRLKSFDCNDFITYQLPFEYKPDGDYPLFQTYLDRVLPDKALQNILSEYLGYVFIRTSTLKLEKALLLYGKGANGKSVFYEISRQLLGEQNVSEYSLQSLTDDRGYSRAMIANKLLNYASEINGKLEASIFKQLVSGEPVEARLPYGNPFIMTDYAKLIFNCNNLPKDVEQTEAYFRRFLIIPFNVTIPEHEQDKQLTKKIIDTELSGIFNWVLEGLKRLLKQKRFTDSEIVHQARAQYERESDSVRLFLEETGYKASADSYISIKVLYPEYRSFCLDNGYKPVSNLNFRKRLENSNIVVEKKNFGNVAFANKGNEYSQASRGQ